MLIRGAINLGSIAAISFGALAGCGLRSIEYGDGSKITELFIGAPTRIDCEAGRTVSGTIRSVGLFGATNGGGLGFSEQDFLCGSGECHLAVWPNDTADLQEIMERVEATNKDCIEALERSYEG